MGEKIKGIVLWLVPLVLLISLTGGVRLYSQFLADEEEYKEETKKPVEKKEPVPDIIARNLKAVSVPDSSGAKCTIEITWDLDQKKPGEYIVAKSNEIIDTAEKARLARVVKTIKGAARNTVVDTDCVPGNHYYVVLSKKSIKNDTIELFPDSNYLSSPVVVSISTEFPIVSNIQAVDAGDLRVRISWSRVNQDSLFYTVYRSREEINNEKHLKKAEKLHTEVDISEYLDGGVATDIPYFYAVTVKPIKGKENKLLVADRNYTTAGAMVTAKKEEQVMIQSISARTEGDGVMVTWEHSGGGLYRLFRSATRAKNAGEVSGGDIIVNVNLSDGRYMDSSVPAGRYYYGLIPEAVADLSSYALVPGMNITRSPVGIREETMEREVVAFEMDDVDRILKRTFFKNKYREAIKELSDYISGGAAERTTAKANLFIGRSYIELGGYRTAANYLLLPNVKKYFPKDADFWLAFALTRIRNY